MCIHLKKNIKIREIKINKLKRETDKSMVITGVNKSIVVTEDFTPIPKK